METNIGIRWQFIVSVVGLVLAAALMGAGQPVWAIVFVVAALYFPGAAMAVAAGGDDQEEDDEDEVARIVRELDAAAAQMRTAPHADLVPPSLTPEQFRTLPAEEQSRLARVSLAMALRAAAYLLDTVPSQFGRIYSMMRWSVTEAVVADILPRAHWLAWSKSREDNGMITGETPVPEFAAFLRDTADFVDDSAGWLEKHAAKPTDTVPLPTVFVHPGVAAAIFGRPVNEQKGVA